VQNSILQKIITTAKMTPAQKKSVVSKDRQKMVGIKRKLALPATKKKLTQPIKKILALKKC